MFVKVTTRYKDSQLSAELPVGVILEVSDERAETLIKAKVAEKFNFPATEAQTKKEKSEDTVVKIDVNDIKKFDLVDEIPEGATVVDGVEITDSKEETPETPKATKAAGK